MKVDVLQVFISTSAIFGIGILWLNFNQKVFTTVWRLVSVPFEEESKKCNVCSEFLSDLCYKDEDKFFSCQDCYEILLQEKHGVH